MTESKKELEIISAVIDANPAICRYILQDLNKNKCQCQLAGVQGMSADQVLRCLVVMTLFGFTYEELALHIVDSHRLCWFCRIGIAEEGCNKSALNRTIKIIRNQTWEMISCDVPSYAQQEKLKRAGPCVQIVPVLSPTSINPALRHCCMMPCVC